MMKNLFGLILVGLFGMPVFSQQAPASQSVSQELKELYAQDQADREGLFTTGEFSDSERMQELHSRDASRRARVKEIVRNAELFSAEDYYHAAMVLQHGADPEDFLLSHILSMVAGFQGHEDARWLAAASLDRFLQNIKRPQVFGTQYTKSPGEEWTMEPYNRELLGDSVRKACGVPPLGEQEQRIRELPR